MPYSTTYYLSDVTMTLSAAWEIPNLFPHSEPGQTSFTNLSCPTVWKISRSQSQISHITVYCEWQVHCNFVLYAVVLINVLMFHVKSSIQLLYAINHSFKVSSRMCQWWWEWSTSWHCTGWCLTNASYGQNSWKCIQPTTGIRTPVVISNG